MNRRPRLVGLLATLLVVGILIGLPATLLALGASPLPHGIPTSIPTLEQVRSALTTPDDGTLALGVIKTVAWVAWAVLAVSILLEIVAYVRGAHAPGSLACTGRRWRLTSSSLPPPCCSCSSPARSARRAWPLLTRHQRTLPPLGPSPPHRPPPARPRLPSGIRQGPAEASRHSSRHHHNPRCSRRCSRGWRRRRSRRGGRRWR